MRGCTGPNRQGVSMQTRRWQTLSRRIARARRPRTRPPADENNRVRQHLF